jgi:hypothetical protein
MSDRTHYQLELAGFALLTLIVWGALLHAVSQVFA